MVSWLQQKQSQLWENSQENEATEYSDYLCELSLAFFKFQTNQKTMSTYKNKRSRQKKNEN